MAAIINEFEVIADDAPQGSSERGQPANGSPSVGVSPRDIAEILRQRAERLARVEAH